MNLYYEELPKYINEINKIDKNIIIAPSSIYLLEFLNKTKHQVSSQDICYIDEGNHTGKVSWKQIKHLGIKYSLIGHSEKHDDINKINAKLKVCLKHKITPILCIGNNTPEEDIIDILNSLEISNIKKIIFAYEPIFNIGENDIDIDYINKEIETIYTYLLDKYKTKPTIIYGGGINEKNINTIYNNKLLKGILIGSISADINKLKKLLLRINEK